MLEASKEEVLEELRQRVKGPETEINVIDMGLVYEVNLEDDRISVDLTAPSRESPQTGQVAAEVETVLRSAFEVNVEVNIVWDPPWDPQMITEEGLEALQKEKKGSLRFLN
ncbi:MAG: metal-sulfur cluster assembly factor [Candidatus Acetothermia bacterium]